MAPPHPLLVTFLLVAVLVQNRNFIPNFSNNKNIKAEFRNINKIVNTRGASRNIRARGIGNINSESSNVMAELAILKSESEIKSILDHLEAVASILEDSQMTPGQEEELEEEWQIYQYYLQWVSQEDQEKEQEWDFYQYYLDTIHR